MEVFFSCTGRGPITEGWAYRWQFTVARQNLWSKAHKDSPPNFNLVEGKVAGRNIIYWNIQVCSKCSTRDSDVYASPVTITPGPVLLDEYY